MLTHMTLGSPAAAYSCPFLRPRDDVADALLQVGRILVVAQVDQLRSTVSVMATDFVPDGIHVPNYCVRDEFISLGTAIPLGFIVQPVGSAVRAEPDFRCDVVRGTTETNR